MRITTIELYVISFALQSTVKLLECIWDERTEHGCKILRAVDVVLIGSSFTVIKM